MNEDIISKMIKPYIKDNSLYYSQFENIFSFLSKREQYEVTNILDKNGINLIDEETDISDNINNLLIESENFTVHTETVCDDVFLENNGSKTICNYKHNAKNINLSNEILCKLIQEGNAQAKQDLCIKNKRLVDKLVSTYGRAYGNDLPFEDLEQAGMIGLLKAAYKFDCNAGYLFSTYATWWIRHSITREIMDHGFLIRLPVHVMELIFKISSLDNKYASVGMDFQQRLESIQAETNLTIEKILFGLNLRRSILSSSSLNTPVGEDEDIELLHIISDESLSVEEIYETKELQNILFNLLNTLTERQRDIINLRFGLLNGRPKTLEEVGHHYNLTRERIRQIEAKAIKRLRNPSRLKLIREYY